MAREPSPARMEAFSDGVIAVIITIMVLDLKVPQRAGIAGLESVTPTLAVYFASFVFVGVYWINHHHLVDKLQRTDALVLWANLFFLFCLSLLPFFTAYLISTEMNTFSVQLYAGSLLTTGFSFQILSRAIVHNLRRTMGLTAEQELLDQAARQHFAELAKGWLSVALYCAAVVLARWLPHAALVLTAAVTLLWIVPTLGLNHGRRMPSGKSDATLAEPSMNPQGDPR